MTIQHIWRSIKNLFPTTAARPPSGFELPPLPKEIGLVDMALSGWLNNETGELIEGFFIRGSDRVLDVGCGDGGFTLFCGRQGAEIFVADINPENVAQASLRLRETAARAVHPLVTDANPIPVQDEQMDKVIAMEVMEHVDDPLTFLKELFRVGKPGAQYLISVPAAISEQVQIGIAKSSYFQKPNHIHIFEQEQFISLVEEAGLRVEKVINYGFYRTLWWLFFWASNQPTISSPWHPLLESWDQTWRILLALPDGDKIKKKLDEVLPKSQVILARKMN